MEACGFAGAVQAPASAPASVNWPRTQPATVARYAPAYDFVFNGCANGSA
ncbi:transposase B [Burkholderia multivorans CGD1]|nr:transposase B [Burkholderia multivorans CGD1]